MVSWNSLIKTTNPVWCFRALRLFISNLFFGSFFIFFLMELSKTGDCRPAQWFGVWVVVAHAHARPVPRARAPSGRAWRRGCLDFAWAVWLLIYSRSELASIRQFPNAHCWLLLVQPTPEAAFCYFQMRGDPAAAYPAIAAVSLAAPPPLAS